MRALVLVCGYWDGSRHRLRNRCQAPLERSGDMWLMSQPLPRGVGYLLDRCNGRTCFELKTGRILTDDHQLISGEKPPSKLGLGRQGGDALSRMRRENSMPNLSKQGLMSIGRNRSRARPGPPAYAGTRVYARADCELVCYELPPQNRFRFEPVLWETVACLPKPCTMLLRKQ